MEIEEPYRSFGSTAADVEDSPESAQSGRITLPSDACENALEGEGVACENGDDFSGKQRLVALGDVGA